MSDQTETLDLVDLLNKSMADFPDRPSLPGGKTVYGKLISIVADRSSEKKTPYFHFTARITDPGKDFSSSDLEKLVNAGFSLADYEVGANYYLTPNAMTMFRRFLLTLGFSENSTFRESLKLADNGEPTPETQDVIRGLDVIIKIPMPNDDGRVFLNNVNDSRSGGFIAGTKRD